MAQHTPGPWRIHERQIGSPLLIGPLGAPTVCYLAANQPQVIAAANARLIAAGPELLEAATQALDVILNETHGQQVTPWVRERLDLLTSAIAKATGRE